MTLKLALILAPDPDPELQPEAPQALNFPTPRRSNLCRRPYTCHGMHDFLV